METPHDAEGRYKRPGKKVRQRKNISPGAAAAVDRKNRQHLKSFINGDKNRQLNGKIAADEKRNTSTWMEIDGKMVAVSYQELKEMQKAANEKKKKRNNSR